MKISRYIIIAAFFLISISWDASSQVPVDSVAAKAASEQEAPAANKNKKKLTKEEKQKIKDLNSVVKTAKYKYTKEEKKQIDKLTILEQDLNDWIKDEQAEWYCVGPVQLFLIPLFGSDDLTTTSRLDKNTAHEESNGNITDPRAPKHRVIDGDVSYTSFKKENTKMEGELWIKQGSRLHARVFYRGDWYDGQRWITVFENGNTYKWRTKDYGLTTYVFNIPDGIVYEDGVLHPEYKEYNPWEYLIDLDKQAGKFSQEDMQKEMNAIRKNAIKAKKAEQKKQKELEKAEKQAAKAKK